MIKRNKYREQVIKKERGKGLKKGRVGKESWVKIEKGGIEEGWGEKRR